MTKGFNVDLSRDGNLESHYHSIWIEGDPSYYESLFGNKTDLLNLTGRKRYYVFALRCEKCGYLENYAV